jgi:hypothetical protein
MMENKLFPCPHCGQEVTMSSRKITRGGRKVYNVHCENPDCGLGVEMDSEESALFVWNNRPSEIKLQARINELTVEVDLSKSRIEGLETDLSFYTGELYRVRELNKNRFTRCTYCGFRIDYYAEDGGDKAIDEMNRHALTCEKDPHNIEIKELRATIATLKNDIVTANQNRIWTSDQNIAIRLELKAAYERIGEFEKLLAMQRKRTVEADKRFREANEVDYWPDLGHLVGWLMEQVDRANAYIANDPRTQIIEDQAIEIEKLKTKLVKSHRWISVAEKLPESFVNKWVTDGVEVLIGFYNNHRGCWMEEENVFVLVSIAYWRDMEDEPKLPTKEDISG